MRIDLGRRNHPFAFMNTMREPVGALYKLGKFQDSHAAAVRRIGLIPAKHLGTSEHGHRHAYGQRLRKAGVSKEMIRRFMHHSDLGSQDVYTAADQAECLRHIQRAVDRLNNMPVDLRGNIVQVTPSDFQRMNRSFGA
jgi:integrase